jgi:L-serine dehydratase
MYEKSRGFPMVENACFCLVKSIYTGDENMDLFDIIGPVMVGPSSSHTAGAARMGYFARKLLGDEPERVKIGLCGSFWATGIGHGTDRALVAGLLGWQPDDSRIPRSLEIARRQDMEVSFYKAEIKNSHPNTAVLQMTGKHGGELEVVAVSLGGGRIRICELDGLTANFSGDYPTLIVHNLDQPGHVTEITAMLAKNHVNIATMQLYRQRRGGNAVMVLECDQEVPAEAVESLRHLQGILKVTYLSLV